MSENLHRDIRLLRRQLRTFTSEARRNEEKMRRFQEQELRLIATRTLADLIWMILNDIRSQFRLDLLSLVLIDPDYELQRILEEQNNKNQPCELIFFRETTLLDALYGVSILPVLGAYDEDRHRSLFPARTLAVASVALLPLMRGGELIGSLNFGSNDGNRYKAQKGTDFLERLAAVVSICLENASNHERLKRIGLTDPLTQLNNRRFFEQRLAEEVLWAKRHRQALTCMFLDVDHFKHINDEYGHQAGDDILRHMAAMIKAQLRGSDIIARFGGEEFVVLLPQTGDGEVLEIAERIRSSIAAADFHLPGDGNYQITISIGVATLQPDMKDAKALVIAADHALYQAKDSGRNRVVCASWGVT